MKVRLVDGMINDCEAITYNTCKIAPLSASRPQVWTEVGSWKDWCGVQLGWCSARPRLHTRSLLPGQPSLLPPHITTTQHRFPGPRHNIGNTDSLAALLGCWWRANMYNAPLPVIRDVCSPLGSAHISRGRHMSWLAAHSKCYVGLLHGGTRHRYTHRAWSKSVDVGLMWRLERVTQLYTGLSSTRSRSTRMLEITGGRSVINIRCRHRTLLYRLVLSRLLCEAAEVRWAGESWSLLETWLCPVIPMLDIIPSTHPATRTTLSDDITGSQLSPSMISVIMWR